jgi:predicted hydrocarbon binding protein
MNAVEDKIPKTGRIGRFAKILKKQVPKELFLKVLKDSDRYSSFSPSKKAEWWRNTVIRMENELGIEKTEEILSICGSRCCGSGHRKTVRKKFEESTSIQEFLKKISAKDVIYTLINNNTILAKYQRCFCGQVKAIKTTFPNLTYCHCSAEFNKQYFSSAFNKPVKVALMKSVISGDDSCQFHVHF